MQKPLNREALVHGWNLDSARHTAATYLRGLATAAALAALLGSAGCMGLTSTKPLAPGGSDSASITVSPSTIAFGNVVVGTSDSQSVKLSNAGDASETISSVAPSGTGFAYTGLSAPITIGAGLSVTFTVSYHPAAAGAASGSISIKSSTATYKVALSGAGVSSAPQISASTGTVSFGNVTVGVPTSQPVVLKNTGNANLALSSVSASGTGFTATGGSGVTLAPDQSVTVTITFDPKATGSVSGGLKIASNATNSYSVTLSGAGVATPASQHSVALNWSASASPVNGYFVYRGTVSGGPYAKLNPSLDAAPSYKDSTVLGGDTYYYVVTSVDSTNVESTYSNQVSVSIPAP
ncbi:MAG TPA: choice-of-anchor D domain-containing protein [Candidatus Acidoferrales bacterium]|jgi:hypothetical protein|nr:choice-of-anchor D domain-containing protein [Candidatus Acidoferrales bacterium]